MDPMSNLDALAQALCKERGRHDAEAVVSGIAGEEAPKPITLDCQSCTLMLVKLLEVHHQSLQLAEVKIRAERKEFGSLIQRLRAFHDQWQLTGKPPNSEMVIGKMGERILVNPSAARQLEYEWRKHYEGLQRRHILAKEGNPSEEPEQDVKIPGKKSIHDLKTKLYSKPAPWPKDELTDDDSEIPF